MSLKAKIEAVIYAAEEPVTLQQLVGLLGQEAQAEIDAADGLQGQLALLDEEATVLVEEAEAGDQDALNAETLGTSEGIANQAAVVEVAAGQQSHAAESDLEPRSAVEPVPGIGIAAEPAAGDVRARERRLREHIRGVLDSLIAEYAASDRGLEVREIAGGFRFATKPEYHDAVRGFVRSLKPPLKLSLQALETLAVVAYKQPVTAPEISEIRGVDSGGVLGSLITRKLVTTAGRKQVIGRPILYKTTREFLLRFGLKDLAELPSIEEFERLASDMNEAVQEEISMTESEVQERTYNPDEGHGSAPLDELNSAPVAPHPVHSSADDLVGDRSVAWHGSRREPPYDAARPASMRSEHSAQPDGTPGEETDDEHLTSQPDGPGEFSGDESVPPVDNASIDGRISGVPPSYDEETIGVDSPALDAEIQSEQAGAGVEGGS